MSNYIEETEIWKVWRDYRGNSNNNLGSLWEVSNLGNVRKNGEPFEPSIHKLNGRRMIGHIPVYWAVAELFLPPNTEHKPTIDHVNRIRTDDRAANLRYATYKEQAENRNNESIAKKARERLTGTHHSEETKRKISEANKGERNAMYGRIPSEETRRKISEKNKQAWAKRKSQS